MDATLDCSKIFVQVLDRAAGLAFKEPEVIDLLLPGEIWNL